MKRTKANFKALREMSGMSQSLLADMLGVRELSVKRWESRNQPQMPPEAAWAIVENYIGNMQRAMQTAFDVIDNPANGLAEPKAVSLTYWQNAAHFKQAHPEEDERLWQLANATSRAIATELMLEGVEFNFDFPGLKAIAAKNDANETK